MSPSKNCSNSLLSRKSCTRFAGTGTWVSLRTSKFGVRHLCPRNSRPRISGTQVPDTELTSRLYYFFKIRILPTKCRAEESENVMKPGDVVFGSTNLGLKWLKRLVTPTRRATRRLNGMGISFSTLKFVTKNVGIARLL